MNYSEFTVKIDESLIEDLKQFADLNDMSIEDAIAEFVLRGVS